jgi:23S rRNA (cytosine1962-C5)-methyltransferase
MKSIQLILKPEKEKPIKGRHPWIYSGAIDRIDDSYKTGDLVRVFSAQKEFLGTGYLNPRSQIAVRMLAFTDEEIDRKFFARRIDEAIKLRHRFLPDKTTAYRVLHSEGDFIPGLIADLYGDYLVVQLQTAGIERWRDTIISILEEKIRVKGIYEKDDSEMREWEGLDKRVGLLRGEEPPNFVEIEEYGVKFIVDIHTGQKTGFFLDQRENRKLVGGLARGGRRPGL